MTITTLLLYILGVFVGIFVIIALATLIFYFIWRHRWIKAGKLMPYNDDIYE